MPWQPRVSSKRGALKDKVATTAVTRTVWMSEGSTHSSNLAI